MWRDNRGMVGIFLEVVIVIVLVFGFLVIVKLYSKPKVAATDVYPGGTVATSANVDSSSASSQRSLDPTVAPTASPKILQDEIVYTDAGFEPDVLQIRNTNRVILFRNKSTQKMFVVSDGYPNLPTLPSLNQAHSVDPGGLYWFAFSAGKGTYTYYNLAHPGHIGVIIAR